MVHEGGRRNAGASTEHAVTGVFINLNSSAGAACRNQASACVHQDSEEPTGRSMSIYHSNCYVFLGPHGSIAAHEPYPSEYKSTLKAPGGKEVVGGCPQSLLHKIETVNFLQTGFVHTCNVPY